MANIFLDNKTKKRLNKALGDMQSKEGSLITFSGAVARLLDLYEKQEVKN